MTNRTSRRRFLAATGATAASLSFLNSFQRVFAADDDRRYRAGIVDWNLEISRGRPEVFAEAKAMGYEGVQFSFLPEGDLDLRKPEFRKQVLDAAKENGMGISTLAMGVLNGRPFASDPDAVEWVSDCIDIMHEMDAPGVLLAFFGKGSIKNDPKAMDATIGRLKELAPKAERLGRKLCVESTLDVRDHMKILDAVASDAVNVYYDIANMHGAGYDIFEEIAFLGKKGLIQEVHIKELGNRLGEGAIDIAKVKQSLDAVDYKGWVIAEAAMQGDKVESRKHNAKFLREMFLEG